MKILEIKFKKSIGKFDILSLAVGSIIGWGAFIMPGALFIPKAGVINTMIALILGAVIMIITEKNFGYLLSKNQVSGGEYAFAYKSFGRKHAFLCGWFLVLSYMSVVPLNATALALIAKAMFPGLLTKGYLYTVAGFEIYLAEVILAMGTLVIFGYFNIKGIKIASLFQKIMVLVLIGIVFMMGSFFMLSPEFDKKIMFSHFNIQDIKFGKVLRILAIAPWAYQGFDCIPQAVEEFDFDVKNASKLAILSIVLGCIIYNILLVITASTFTQEVIINGKINWATGQAVEILFGKLGFYCLGVALLMAIIGGVNGYYLTASRLIYAMARSGAIPKTFSKLTPKGRTPKNAILFIMAFSMIAPLFGRSVLLWIVDMSAIGATIGYGYTSWSAYIQAKEENEKTIMVTGALAGILNIIFTSILLIPSLPTSLSRPSLIVLGIWSLLGIIFYKTNEREFEKINKKELDRLILKEY